MSTEFVTPPRQELPIWMQQALQGVDWGAFIVIAFCVLIGWNHVSTPDIVLGKDTEHFLYLADEFVTGIEEGIFLPQWSAQSLSGAGAPIPAFYPPGIPHAIALLHLIFTNDSIIALDWLYLLATVLMGSTLYALITHYHGSHAGIIAALLLVTSPYISLTLAHITGNIAEYVGIALLCTQIWAVHRFVTIGSPADSWYLILIQAVAVLSSPFHAAIGTVCAVIFLWNQNQRSLLKWGLLFLTLGILLAAYFWLPFIIEAGYIQWSAVAQTRTEPITLSAILSPHQLLSGNLLNHPPQSGMGLPILLLGLIGLISALRHIRRFAFFKWITSILFFIVLAIITSDSRWIGMLTVLVASIVGYSSTFWVMKNRFKVLLLGLIVAIVWCAVIPIYALLPQVSIAYQTNIPNFEASGYGIAALPDGMSLPVAPDTLEYLLNSPPPLNRIRFPSDTGTASAVSETSHIFTYQITTTTAEEIEYWLPYFEGWSANLDGTPLPIRPDPDSGLTRIAVPANAEGLLTIRLDLTPIRSLGRMISVLALLASTGIYIYRRQHAIQRYPEINFLNNAEKNLLWIIFGAIVLTLVLIPRSQFSGLEPLLANRWDASFMPAAYTVTDQLVLKDYRISSTSLSRGETLSISLLWETNQAIDVQYVMRIRLIDTPRSENMIASDYQIPGDLPVSRWVTEYAVEDIHHLQIPADVNTGNYVIRVEIASCEIICKTSDNQQLAESTLISTILLPVPIEIR